VKIRLLALASLATLTAGTTVAVTAATTSGVAAYPACVNVTATGTLPISRPPICVGNFSAVLCDSPKVTLPGEIIIVTVCVPDNTESASSSDS
jgi:hypothetical protein